jgi:hypothetical protein
MELPRLAIFVLEFIWSVSLIAFVVEGVLAVGSGITVEYKLFGVQFPYAAGLLLLCMATSSGLLWANCRGKDFKQGELLVYGALFGISVFGLISVAPLILLI